MYQHTILQNFVDCCFQTTLSLFHILHPVLSNVQIESNLSPCAKACQYLPELDNMIKHILEHLQKEVVVSVKE